MTFSGTASFTLDDHLSACLRDSSLGSGGFAARREFRAATQRDPVLRAEASAKLAALVPAITDKCFISRMHKSALEECLKDG